MGSGDVPRHQRGDLGWGKWSQLQGLEQSWADLHIEASAPPALSEVGGQQSDKHLWFSQAA